MSSERLASFRELLRCCHNSLGVMPKSYLDLLPDEMLERIVRFLSSCPNQKHWRFGISIPDAIALYEFEGPLAVAARKLFDTISTFVPYSEDPGLFVDIKNSFDVDVLCDLLEFAGPSVKNLNIGSLFPPVLSWIAPFSLHCVNVTNLNLYDIDNNFPLEDVLRARSGCWDDLSLSNRAEPTPAQVHAIATHCKGLRSLKLAQISIRDDLVPIWEGIGSTLAYISLKGRSIRGVTAPGDEEDIFKGIKGNCPLVDCLDFGDLMYKHRAVAAANLCAHYGSQLKHVSLTCARQEEEVLPIIVNNCPSVEIHTAFSLYANAKPFRIMGPRASKVHVHVPRDPFYLASFENCTRECQNLRALKLKLTFRECGEVLRLILNGPKPLLEEFSMEIAEEEMNSSDEYHECMTNALTTLSQMTGNLRRFVIDAPFMRPRAFARFARANQGLEEVVVVCRDIDKVMSDGEETALASWVADFGTCPVLRNMFLKFGVASGRALASWTARHDKIVRVCEQLRGRTLDVTIAIYDYL